MKGALPIFYFFENIIALFVVFKKNSKLILFETINRIVKSKCNMKW
jgi:hypothetical protein